MVLVLISGVTGTAADRFNGSYFVSEIVSPTRFRYIIKDPGTGAPAGNPTASGAQVQVEVDNVDSSSPYIFNISLRSTWGTCGMHADGAKATGFKSMVVAQFTGVSLQKDDNAFIRSGTDQHMVLVVTLMEIVFTNQNIETSMSNVLMMRLFRQYLFSLLVSLIISLPLAVATSQLPTLTQTSDLVR